MDPQSNSNGSGLLEWPYPIKYDVVNHIYVDVLVVGGGFAGCCAGLSAARRGMKVAVVDKAPIKRSGNGGAGMDHWNKVFENPDSPMSAEEVCEQANGYSGLMYKEYICTKGTWDALMELERLGLKIRDEGDDFLGAKTRREDGYLRAFDYTQTTSIKLRHGQYIKPVLYNGLLNEPNVSLYERVMMTCLLTENGEQEKRVVGATGFSMETGEFYVFHCKSVILATGYISTIWICNLEITGNSYHWDPNEIGEGMTMAWNAGADVYAMWVNGGLKGSTPFAWPRFGVGNPNNTWYPCTIVDNNGKVIPWVDANGNIVETAEERNVPPEGVPFYVGALNWRKVGGKKIKEAGLIPDLGERIRNGEFELPLWADLSGMPEDERRSIWGLMIGNEGKTRYTLYDYYTRWGFDPDQDMLMAPIMDPDLYAHNGGWFMGIPDAAKPWRTERGASGDVAVDWDLMTSIPGLFAAGGVGGTGGCAFACSAGFYSGNRAAAYCQTVEQGEIDQAQLEKEHQRVYAPVKRANDPKAYVSWKELWAGSCRVMQSDCADYLTIPVLEHGLFWLKSISEYEAQLTYARNPHELARVLECETRITCSEAIIKCCIEKLKAEQAGIPKEKKLFMREVDGKVITTIKDDKFWLQEPNAPTYLENYKRHTSLEKETM